MELGYDIFRGLENGEVIWLGCAGNLDEAKTRVVALAAAKPARYFIRSASTGEIVANFEPGYLGEACA